MRMKAVVGMGMGVDADVKGSKRKAIGLTGGLMIITMTMRNWEDTTPGRLWLLSGKEKEIHYYYHTTYLTIHHLLHYLLRWGSERLLVYRSAR